ncbi:transcriptional repressor DicA [Legionella quinlivanii]|uniref:Transcriptional repressor DicA n=1 Tax=Legionella quinlivanii TaxID=45073 RepID=A0A0W0XUE5_9GAMM|nr:helix-turn-helix domain-containing protein [Legionella quinlivanii]KTD48079.1 transcriptional repressor DicA [Legionella quinlivanii]SEG48575.1 putative transcriptional regulator [Legionella quinlivanii DSM 21216]STY49787.1 putative zinc finger/helix-turn-helix protein, YgiT family [Legionella quinlivanii]
MSKIIEAVLEAARDIRLDPITIREIELLNVSEVKELQANEIKKMRIKENLSQTVMAKILNVTPSTYQKWERGEVHPRGANLKLLRLAYTHGINYIL